VRVFGIDPGSERTGYGCVETDGRRHRLVICGAISTSGAVDFATRLSTIHAALVVQLHDCGPAVVAIESLFHAANVRSALKLGHARGVAMLAAVQAGVPVVEYSPSEVKRAVVGYGRAEKAQVQQMIKLLLGLEQAPTPHDAADALAVALCHAHRLPGHMAVEPGARRAASPTSWRAYRPAPDPAPKRPLPARRGTTRP
jgi:crossover junction endodeoxyribonuclease RuvC